MAAVLETPIMAKKKEPTADAVIKVEPDLHHQLSVLAAAKKQSLKELAEALFREYVDREWVTTLAEMQKKK